jgi:hypothetical protein
LIAPRSVAVAALLVAAFSATTARAQHRHEPGPAAHAAKPVSPSAETPTQAPAAKVPVAPKRRNTTDLAKKLKEILDEANAAHRTPDRAQLAPARPAPATPAVPRIELTWRVAVTWPADLERRRLDPSTTRIALDWQ